MAGTATDGTRQGDPVAAMRARLAAAPRGRRASRWTVAACAGLAVLLLGAGVVTAQDNAGVIDFFRAEAARRLPEPVARIVAPPPSVRTRFTSISTPPRSERIPAVARAPRVAPAPVAATPRLAGTRTVCVRLCDGYHFPMSAPRADRAGQQASCEAACPHAPVALFTLAPGSVDVATARAVDGTPYRSLAQAFAYQSRRVAACSCQGPDNVARRIAPAADPTLRRGDVFVSLASARAYAGEGAGFEDFRRSRALSPTARSQVDRLLAVSSREARRQAFLRTMAVVRFEPVRSAAIDPALAFGAAPPRGFTEVRTVVASPFTAVN